MPDDGAAPAVVLRGVAAGQHRAPMGGGRRGGAHGAAHLGAGSQAGPSGYRLVPNSQFPWLILISPPAFFLRKFAFLVLWGAMSRLGIENAYHPTCFKNTIPEHTIFFLVC